MIADFDRMSMIADIFMIFLRTPADLGALIREHRRKLGLDQSELARRAGASRQWVIAMERGKPRAEVGLVFRALAALGIALTVAEPGAVDRRSGRRADPPPVDINRIISSLRRSGP